MFWAKVRLFGLAIYVRAREAQAGEGEAKKERRKRSGLTGEKRRGGREQRFDPARTGRDRKK